MMRPGLIFAIAALAAACGGGDGGDDGPPCPGGNCGQASFRRAVPTVDRLRIASPTGAPGKPGGVLPLDAVSDKLVAVDAEVDDINLVIDDIFADLDDAASTAPEIESDAEHQWRYQDLELGLDEVVRITTEDGVTFHVEQFVGAAGLDPATATPVLAGDVIVEDEEAGDFALAIDLDAYAAATGEVVQGDVVIALLPLEGGVDEIWFDYHEVSIDGGEVETSRTTAWVWDEASVGLEYLADIDGNFVTVYARWDDLGGRYDHHVAYDDPAAGPLDEIATACWTESGAETFDAWAVIDGAGDYYGELDGDEASCDFGPVADHPTPGEDFDDLPAEGEWTLLELGDICSLIPCASG